MLRDFSETSKQKLLSLINDVENEKLCDFTDWIGDRWYDFEEFTGQLSTKSYIDNMNSYHKKVIDKNNTTKDSIERIFRDVANVNVTYTNVFSNIDALFTQWNTYMNELQGIISPSNGRFQTEYMNDSLINILEDIEKDQIKYIHDKMVKNIDGEYVFNEELLYEYMKKSPAELSGAEKKVLVDILAEMQDVTAAYEILATYGTDNLGADILNSVSWLSNSTKYESFTAVSAHYNEIYVNLLNFMVESSRDENSFASSIIKATNGSNTLEVLGNEYVEKLNQIFENTSFTAYLTKYTSEHSESYFAKLEASETEKLKASGEFTSLNKFLSDKLEDSDLSLSESENVFYDKNGNELTRENAPVFYKTQLSILEFKKQASASISLYDGTYNFDGGSISAVVGEAEAHGSISAGLYVLDSEGNKKFSPGVNAEIGASATALELSWDQQWLGDDMLGLHSNVTATAGKVEAVANFGAKIFNEDGKLDVQLGGSAKAEAIGGEIEGSAGIDVLGGEVGINGSLNYGVGAHADVGYRDGVFKFDIGASLGVGASVGFDIDVGGMIDTVADAASSAWDDVCNGWDDFWS